nr:hypothetical protein Hi04_10k_c554_00008 [uncultured bacterium]
MKKKSGPGSKDQPKKKEYRAPKLVVHGDVRRITQSKGASADDGSGKPHTKSPTGPGT